ncbi:MAG: hemerythrin domain-containing protein [Deltaproteobacteria bacterium]|nr:hemerythrin domain-containing protein [Deltaproteobacteria bacterium]
MNATDVLERQQHGVLSLFDELEITDDALQRTRLMGLLALRLKTHAAVKEDVFYPAVREREPGGVDEALAAHRAIDLLLDEAVGTPTDANVKVLRGVVEQLFGEERARLFTTAERLDESARHTLAEHLGRYAHAVEASEAGEL